MANHLQKGASGHLIAYGPDGPGKHLAKECCCDCQWAVDWEYRCSGKCEGSVWVPDSDQGWFRLDDTFRMVSPAVTIAPDVLCYPWWDDGTATAYGFRHLDGCPDTPDVWGHPSNHGCDPLDCDTCIKYCGCAQTIVIQIDGAYDSMEGVNGVWGLTFSEHESNPCTWFGYIGPWEWDPYAGEDGEGDWVNNHWIHLFQRPGNAYTVFISWGSYHSEICQFWLMGSSGGCPTRDLMFGYHDHLQQCNEDDVIAVTGTIL